MNEPVAIITGAGRGIGRETAIELSRRSYHVVLVSRTESELRETAKLCGERAIFFTADANDDLEAHRVVQRAREQLGRIDALVNNAGYAPVLTVEQTTPEHWRRIIESNLSSAFYFVRAVWSIMREQGGGAIVNVSSYSARDPLPGLSAYGSAKAGLILLGLSLAREGESLGIRVHTIAPGAVETQMLRKIMTPQQLPSHKTLSPADVARVIAQCICGELRHTSGEVVYLHKGP